MATEESMYAAYNPYRHSYIGGPEIPLAYKTLRDIRQALEHDIPVLGTAAQFGLADILKEAEKIREILDGNANNL